MKNSLKVLLATSLLGLLTLVTVTVFAKPNVQSEIKSREEKIQRRMEEVTRLKSELEGWKMIQQGQEKLSGATQSVPSAEAVSTQEQLPVQDSSPVMTATNASTIIKKIDQYLGEHGSPMQGTTSIHYAKMLEFYPNEAEAITQMMKSISISNSETEFCTTGVAKYKNCWGIKAIPKFKSTANGWFRADSWEESYYRVAYLLKNGGYGNYTLSQIAQGGVYCQSSCRDWEAIANNTYNELRSL